MGYVAVPSVLHTRTLYRPHTTPGTFGVLTGVGGDTGLVVWYSHKLLSWVITRTDQEGLPFDVISLAGRTIPARALINESPAWGMRHTRCTNLTTASIGWYPTTMRGLLLNRLLTRNGGRDLRVRPTA